jgi:hypothetical protein
MHGVAPRLDLIWNGAPPMRRLRGICLTDPTSPTMCGRVIQSSAPIRLAILDGLDVHDSRIVEAAAKAEKVALERFRTGAVDPAFEERLGARIAAAAARKGAGTSARWKGRKQAA